MAKDEFELSDLREALSEEKKSKRLCELPDEFYKDVREYLSELEDEIEDTGVRPGTHEDMLRKEFVRANNYVKELFHRRSQKIVSSSVHNVRGAGEEDVNRMTDREKELFRDLSGLLEEMKEEVFSGGYKRKPDKEEMVEEKSEGEEEKEEERVEKKQPDESVKQIDESMDEMKGEEKIDQTDEPVEQIEETIEPSQKEVETTGTTGEKEEKTQTDEETVDVGTEEILVHVIDDVPAFVDIDAAYDLKKEDVVTLREDLADILINRDLARKIELS